jgi:hypothetical protein
VAGIIAAGQTLTLVRLWPQWRRERRLRAAVLFLGSAVLYGDELWTAWRLVGHTMDTDALSTLCALLLGAYAVGLGRAWELLGARSGGLVTGLITTWLAARRSSDRAGDEAPRQDSIPKGPEPEVDGEP